jgi:PIN domain nuclease of toxin-antitoxin system
MAHKYVLDTHALIWYLEANPRLGSKAKTLLDDPASELVLPVIALAEAVFIVERGRTGIPDASALLERIDGDHRISLYPLDRPVLDKTLNLREIPEMHDRQIAATALLLADQGHTSVLITKDTYLLASPAVATAW